MIVFFKSFLHAFFGVFYTWIIDYGLCMNNLSIYTQYQYKAFGLVIESELEFPELLIHQPLTHEPADVNIQWGHVSALGLENPEVLRPFFQAKKDSLWLNVTDVARFLITNGRYIRIEPYAGIDVESIRLFILGSCMGALLMQRDLFLLHGNAVRIGDHCISFVGDSGAGKSTLSGAFFKRGYSILADDVCAINQDLAVLPSFPQIKLWSDSANQLNIKTDFLRRIRPRFDKFAIPLASQFHTKTLPIRVVYCLNKNSEEFHAHRLAGLNKMKLLHQHIYRRHYLRGLNKHQEYHMQCARMAKHIDVVELHRPDSGFQLEQLMDFVEQDLIQSGLL